MLSCRSTLAAIAVFAASVPAVAEQSALPVPLIGAPSFFHASADQAAAAPSATPSAAVTRSGYADINISGLIKSNVPPAASRKLICYLSFGTQGFYSVSRYAFLPAVISGNSFTCTGKIYYKWTIVPTDHLGGSGVVLGVDTKGGATILATTGSTGVNFSFAPTASFPANGAVTKLTANVNF